MSRAAAVRPLLVVGVLGIALGVASAAWPTSAHPSSRVLSKTTPVTTRQLVCPSVSGQPGRSVTQVFVVGPPDVPGKIGMIGMAGGGPIPSLRAEGGGQALATTGTPGGAAVVGLSGTLAASAVAGQFTRTVAGAARGFSDTECISPGQEFWFLGAATTVGVTDSLLLANTADVAATVNVTVFGPGGAAAGQVGQGIVVSPRQARWLRLDQLDPDQSSLAVHVVTSSGRVAAAVFSQRGSALAPQGVDWIPATAGPAKTLVLPGIPDGSGLRAVDLANPGALDATASVRISGVAGSFVPTGLDAIRIPAGQVKRVDITASLAGHGGAVVIHGDQPLVASALSIATARSHGFTDVAWSAVVPPLSGTALVPAVGGHAGNSLLISAPVSSAPTVRLRLTALYPTGRLGRTSTIVVAPGRSTRLAVGSLDPAGAFSVLVTVAPGSGPAYVVAEFTDQTSRGAFLALAAAHSQLATVTVPPVVADPAAALP